MQCRTTSPPSATCSPALTDLRRSWERPDRKRWFLAELGMPVGPALLRTVAAVRRGCTADGPVDGEPDEPVPATVGAVADREPPEVALLAGLLRRFLDDATGAEERWR